MSPNPIGNTENAEMNTTSLEGSYETYQEENGANSPKNMGNDHLQSKYRHTKRSRDTMDTSYFEQYGNKLVSKAKGVLTGKSSPLK